MMLTEEDVSILDFGIVPSFNQDTTAKEDRYLLVFELDHDGQTYRSHLWLDPAMFTGPHGQSTYKAAMRAGVAQVLAKVGRQGLEP